MNPLLRRLSTSLPSLRLSSSSTSSSLGIPPPPPHQQQWTRGIRVKVVNGNLDQALAVMQRKMTASGMERLIRRQVGHHLKNSEKRVLARKRLELRIRSEDLARKLRTILLKKIRSFFVPLCPSLSLRTLCQNPDETLTLDSG
ncbi:Ribosomal protein S21 protein [Dioscorea alata]|nr:Ribosomal protein S21 protein [Dioscorea alata]